MITVSTKQETPQCVSITIHGPDTGLGPKLIGYLEITAVPKGARIDAWDADDMPVDTQIIVRGEES